MLSQSASKQFLTPMMPVLVLVFLTLGCQLFGCTKERGRPPSPTAIHSAKIESPKITYESEVLANGLRVILQPDTSTAFATINMSLLAGSSHERAGEEGAAYLLQYLLFQAGAGLSDPVLLLFETAGADIASGAVSSTVDNDRTTLTSTLPASAATWALWLESKRLQGFLDNLSNDVFINQRSHIRDSLLQAREKPYGMQNDLISRHLYAKNHPYGHPVTASPEEIGRLSLEQVKAFYRRTFTPQNAVLVVSGNIDISTIRSAIKTYFAPLKPVSSSTQIAGIDTETSTKLLVHQSSAPSKQVFIWKGPGYYTADLTALDLAATIFAGGKSSVFHHHLVQQKKLASRVNASLQPSRLSSEFVIEVVPQAGVAPEKISREVQKILQEATSTGLGETEVAAAKAKMEFDYFTSIESTSGPQGKAERLARSVLFGQSADRFAAELDQIVSQTPATVKDALKSWLAKEPALEIRFKKTELTYTSPSKSAVVPPAVPEKMPIAIPTFVRKTLPNGIDLIVFQRPDSQNIEIDLVIKTADLFEADERSGISLLTAKSVLAGTKSRSAFQIENAVNSFGGHLVSDGNKFGARLTINGLKRHLEGIFELLADVAINPVFPKTELDAVKTIVVEKLTREQQHPQYIANRMFNKILFAGGHPGGFPTEGRPTLITRITPAQIKEHHQKYWIPNNAALIVSGPVSVDDVEKLTNKHFTFWSQKTLEAVTLQEQSGPDRTYTFLIDAPELGETLVRLGSVAPYRGQADETGLQLLSQILNDRNARSRKHAQVTGATPSTALIMNRYFGYWMQSAASDPGEALTVLSSLRTTLATVSGLSNSIGSDELLKAQNDLARRFLRSFDTSANTNKITAGLISSGISPESMNRFLPDLYQHSAGSLRQLAGRYFGPNRQIVLLIGNITGIEQELHRRKTKDVIILDREGKFLRKSGS